MGARPNRRRDRPALHLRMQALWARAALLLPARPWVVGAMAACAVSALAVHGARALLDHPVREVLLEGRFQRVLPLDVQRLVRRQTRGEGLLTADLDAVAGAVRSLPWVDSVSVGRRWPDGLVVHVVEQEPVARWGDDALVNRRGEVFIRDLRQVPAELPRLMGPAGSEAEVTRRFLAARASLVGHDLELVRVELDPRGAWQMILANGVLLRLGRHDVDARFQRFIESGTRVVATRAAEIAYIDLRYASGFAVGVRTTAGGPDGQAT
ncbi:MAG: hypothetical protein RL026_513 [Pseudomonadota bacterium]|jgi:cell division protein FtsQ